MQIRIRNLSYTYQRKTPFEKKVLDEVDLFLESNKWYGIIGETGSGKSTLVQNMNGLLTPTAGSVQIGQKRIGSNRKKNPPLFQDVGMVFQYPEHQLFGETVQKDIAYGLKNLGYPKEQLKERVIKALLQVGLNESFLERSPFQLSGGEKRRVAIAGVLVMQPHILIVDEPAAGLDSAGKKAMMSLFQEWRRASQGTIIMISHDMNDILAYTDEVILMKSGRVYKQGPPLELFTEHQQDIYKAGLEPPKIIQFVEQLNQQWQRKLSISSTDQEEIIGQIARHIQEVGVRE